MGYAGGFIITGRPTPIGQMTNRGAGEGGIQLGGAVAGRNEINNRTTACGGFIATRGFDAEGIRLCRTERMFVDQSLVAAVREVITADDGPGAAPAWAESPPFQRSDSVGLFKIMPPLGGKGRRSATCAT